MRKGMLIAVQQLCFIYIYIYIIYISYIYQNTSVTCDRES
jgi:hypothetical protein